MAGERFDHHRPRPRDWRAHTLAIAWGSTLLLSTCGHRPTSAPIASRCGQIDHENRDALGTLARKGGNSYIAEFGAVFRDALRCVETPHGAWGLTIGALTATSDAIGGHWSIVYVDAAGGRVSVSPDTSLSVGGVGQEPATQTQNLEWSGTTRIVPAAPVLFDFDGDGNPEAVVVVRTDMIQESGISFHILRGRIWAVREGAVALYGPAREFIAEEIHDVDGDGRPDIFTHEPYADATTIQCGSEDVYPVYGPKLLAHSLVEGSFSRTDATAVSFAKRECANLPRPAIVDERDRPEIVDFARSARNIACARLWGAEEGTLVSEITTRCHPLNQCSTCDDKAMLERWATINPPLRIR